MPQREIYISTDIETTGPIPGEYSMISLGAVAVDVDGILGRRFKMNLLELPTASRHPDTMEWWKGFPREWEGATEDAHHPKVVMEAFVKFVKAACQHEDSATSAIPVFVGKPAHRDFQFVYWYLIKFLGESPFSHNRAINIRTMIAAQQAEVFVNVLKRLRRDVYLGKDR